ncbi:MAG: signal peptidase I [Clostridiales Family XIII bacterium]|jgi:signal peptidase I|nr:signal peptidase I [Clostridiales Family XIII bacterium]
MAIRKFVEKQTEESGSKDLLLLIRDILIAFAVIVVFLQFLGPTIVFESSMENTMHENDYVFLAKKAYAFGGNVPERGDIIVFRSELLDTSGTAKNLIKRVVGLPGETVEVHDGAVWIDGARLDEPYTKEGETLGEMAAVTVPEGSYFVMGDNRRVSADSRDPDIGCVPLDVFRGKVVFRLLPFSKIGPVH